MKIDRIRLDIDKKLAGVIPSVQWDNNTRYLHINVLNGTEAFNLSGYSVKVAGLKPDGTSFFNDVRVINAREGFIEVVLTEQMNAAAGSVKCELKLYNSRGVLSTQSFIIHVEPSVTPKGIVSSNEFKALTDALLKVGNIDTKFDTLTVDSITKATEKEIQKQIALGNMSNLAIPNGSITQDKLSPSIKFGIEDGEVTNSKLSKNSVTKEKVEDGAITPEKLSTDILVKNYIDDGTTEEDNSNLFNKYDVVVGYVDKNTGTIMQSGKPSDRASGFIAVQSNTHYIRNPQGSISTGNRTIAFFNANQQYIQGITYQQGEYNITTPTNCKFLRFGFLIEDIDKEFIKRAQLAKAPVLVGYKLKASIIGAGDITPAKLSDAFFDTRVERIGENLFNKDDIYNGYINWQNGKFMETTGLDRASGFIAVEPNTKYMRNPQASIATLVKSIVFYTKEQSYISGISPTPGTYEYTTPPNCYYVRFNFAANYLDDEYFYQYTKKLNKDGIGATFLANKSITLDKLAESIIEDLSAKHNLFNKYDVVVGYVGNGDGNVYTNGLSTDRSSGFIAVKGGTKYKRNPLGSISTGRRTICFYNGEKQFISGTTYPQGEYIFTTPSTCKYIRFTFVDVDLHTEYICLESVEVGFKINKNLLPSNIGNNSNSSGIENTSETGLMTKAMFNLDVNTKMYKQGMISPDGTEHVLSVTNDGEFIAIPKSHIEFPSEYGFTVTGRSLVDDEMYICGPRTKFISILNSKGYVKWYKPLKIGGYNFRKLTSDKGEIRYLYADKNGKSQVATNGGFTYNDLVIMNDKFVELKRVALLASGSIADGFPMEDHDYIYFNDDHYIIPTYHPNVVTNVPNTGGKRCKVLNCVLQEIKNGKVVFHWESINHPEFYTLSHYNNRFTDYHENQNVYNDYMHINSFVIDKRDGNLLVSARHIGFFKINRTTGELMWVIGKNRCDFSGVTANMIPSMQHDAKYNYDNSITLYDNSGCPTDNARICRYWLDEENLKLEKFKEYITPYKRSPHMGGATLIDDELELFDISFGGDPGTFPVGFHEYSFKHKKEYLNYKHDNTNMFYRIFRNEKYGRQE